jgi:hypothetical protein
MPVRLICCDAGNPKGDFAQKLANILGVVVRAADAKVHLISELPMAGQVSIAPSHPQGAPDHAHEGRFWDYHPGSAQANRGFAVNRWANRDDQGHAQTFVEPIQLEDGTRQEAPHESDRDGDTRSELVADADTKFPTSPFADLGGILSPRMLAS